MPGATTTTADAVLKDIYEGPVRETINQKNFITAQVTKNTKDFVGRRAIIPLHISRNVGVGARLEGETLPEAGRQGYVDQVVAVKSHYGAIRFTMQAITRMASDRGSFIRMASSEMKGLAQDEAREYNREIWGSSDGKIAQCGTTTASTTLQLAATTPEEVMWSFATGSRVDIGTNANPQLIAANREVSTVDFTNKTVVISGGAVTTSSSHFVYRQGAGGTGASQREITSVPTMVTDTGSLFGVDPATYPTWSSVVDGNSGTTRPFSENLFAKTVMRVTNRSGSDRVTAVAEDGVYRSVAGILQARMRAVNTLDLKGGHKALAIGVTGNEYGLKNDKDAPPGKMFLLSLDEFTEYVDEDWQWWDDDGPALQRPPDRTHALEAIYYKFSELATSNRNAHGRIDDLDVA
jgi:hypothetical protein